MDYPIRPTNIAIKSGTCPISLEDYLNDPYKFQTWSKLANEILLRPVGFSEDRKPISFEQYIIGYANQERDLMLPDMKYFGMTCTWDNVVSYYYEPCPMRILDIIAKQEEKIPFAFSVSFSSENSSKVLRRTTYVPLN